MKTWRCNTDKKPFFQNRQWEYGEVFTGETANKWFDEIGDEKQAKANKFLENVKKVVRKLDHDDDRNWTSLNLPSVKAVSDALGTAVGRDTIEEACPGFKRDMKTYSQTRTMTPNVNI